jgi:type IV pilus assembly protein PilY1
MKTEFRNRLLLTLLLIFTAVATTALLPGFVQARECTGTNVPCISDAECVPPKTCDATSSDYCINPAFITAGVHPNLLLMIDNSASMYDLEYQDTANFYCGNDPTTACATGDTCSGTAYCLSSGTTTSTDVCNSKPCTSDAACLAAGSKCSNGFCSKCSLKFGVCEGDCTTAAPITETTFLPTRCDDQANPDSFCNGLKTGDTCNNKCSVSRQCYDATYSDTTTYSGYLDSASIYRFNFTDNKFESEVSPGVAVPMPGTCTYSAGTTKYLCVNTSGSPEAVTADSATGFIAKGNFLNWLTTSKFDVEKRILTGGKYDTTDHVLLGESRGCAGRKFIKVVPGVDLTFAIRGGTAGGISSTQSQATEYGQTYIELFVGEYNDGDCLDAMNDWMQVTTSNPPQLGAFQNDTKGCVGTGGELGGVTAVSVWNHILHDCYQGITGGAQGYATNLGPLLDQCKSIYATIPPASMTDISAGYAVCSSVLTYGGSTPGYLGACWDDTNFNFTTLCPDTALPSNDKKVQKMADYCNVNVNSNPVMDPSTTSLSTTQSAPGFILEQGLLNTTIVGTFPVKVAYELPGPIGLINNIKYKDLIRFGAMTFQNNSAGSECGTSSTIPCSKTCLPSAPTRICYFTSDCPSGDTCTDLDKTDGSKMISYVGSGKCSDATTIHTCDVDSDCSSYTPSGQYCVPDVGDHSSGLIKAINDIPATSWTPFAEAFYNAIGYYARTNDYSVATPTSRSDANFSQLPSPNTAASYNASKNPSQYKCQANNLLLITDGMSTADKNTAPDALAALYAASVPNIINLTIGTTTNGISGYDTANSCPAYEGSRSVSALAWIAKNRNIKTLVTSGTASTTEPLNSSEAITSYVVYNGPQISGATGLCDPKTLMTNTAANGGTTLLEAANPQALHDKIDAAFSSVAAKAASGTAASILSNSEGSGANILQAVFYPKKYFDSGTYADWIGEMLNLWYFVDPYINNSTIREDSDLDNTLNLINDRVARFAFDNSTDRTMVQLYSDDNGDGLGDTAINGLIDPDDVKTLWRAGRLLWQRDLSASPRTIYTPLLTGGTEVTGTGLMKFTWASPDNSAVLQTPMQFSGDNAATVKLMKWVHGFDFPAEKATIRNRTVKYGSIPAATISSVATDLYVTNPRDKGIGVWKLGDIISSTPRVQSTIRQNTYDLPRPGGYLDKSYASYVTSKDYAKRGMVYVGANDGMLHAFHLGVLSVKASGFQKASLSDPDSIGYGKEMWAFIPKNFLPYLKYQAEPDARHLYAVDGRTSIFDASIGDTATGDCVRSTYWLCDKGDSVVDSAGNLDATKNTWRSIVIGGMGLGGASRDSCPVTDHACVQTPSGTLGYSSYFALDVTDPVNPKLLWEFNHNSLGYSTTGPAIIRVGADRNKNGRWLAVFGNGPFGKIDTNANQFQGNSDHHLRFFFVDLRTGELIKPTLTSTDDTMMTDIDNGFAGSMLGAAIDADRWEATTANYQDDAIYVGYTKAVTSGVIKWTDGGVGRIMIDPLPAGTDPTNANLLGRFHWSKAVDNIGPVTTGISRLQDRKNKNLWLFFGTGRYFFRDSVGLDDRDSRRALYGIKEPCYTTGNHIDTTCNSAISGFLVDQTSSIGIIAAGDPGWKIDLDPSTTAGVDGATTSEGAERVVTDTVALTNGTVFFTSFKPTMDICGYGGNSYLWGVKYDTGGQAAANALKGKALIQLSTGEFKEVDLANAFTDTATLNRRMATPMTGKPPSDAPPIISSSQNKPVKKILHIQER